MLADEFGMSLRQASRYVLHPARQARWQSPLGYATDQNLISLAFKFFAAAVPTAPLADGTTYRASFAGKIDGTAYSKTWSFTTKTAL